MTGWALSTTADSNQRIMIECITVFQCASEEPIPITLPSVNRDYVNLRCLGDSNLVRFGFCHLKKKHQCPTNTHTQLSPIYLGKWKWKNQVSTQMNWRSWGGKMEEGGRGRKQEVIISQSEVRRKKWEQIEKQQSPRIILLLLLWWAFIESLVYWIKQAGNCLCRA